MAAPTSNGTSGKRKADSPAPEGETESKKPTIDFLTNLSPSSQPTAPAPTPVWHEYIGRPLKDFATGLIINADPTTIIDVLREWSRSDPTIAESLIRRLGKHDLVLGLDGKVDEAIEEVKKREPKVCDKCGTAYTEAENAEGLCPQNMYHPGKMHSVLLVVSADEVDSPEMNDDSEHWADMWEHDMAMMDTSFEENPKGYMFPCCYEEGTAEGCKVGRHITELKQRA